MHEEVSELLPFLCNHQLFSCSWICCRTHTQEHTHSSPLCALKAARITLHLSAGLLDLVTLARSIHLSAGRLTCSFSLSVRLSLSPAFSPFLSFSTQIFFSVYHCPALSPEGAVRSVTPHWQCCSTSLSVLCYFPQGAFSQFSVRQVMWHSV